MKALLIVDVQNDFCPGGALGVEDGDKIIPVINRLSGKLNAVLQTQDWHPQGHSSFASSHEGKKPYETIEMDYGEQVLWPDHCVQGTEGAEFHPDLDTNRTQLIIRKGFNKQLDSYSTFFENDHKTSTGLSGYLKDRSIDTIYLCGLATDFCVFWSALDGIKEGFEIFVVEDAVKGIDIDGSVAAAWKRMTDAGAKKIRSSKLLNDNSSR